jgi:AcrR family transcriptional regulator
VSQPTVYRHLPDRNALLEGLTDRIVAIAAAYGDDGSLKTLDDLAAQAVLSVTRGKLPARISFTRVFMTQATTDPNP